ncbi:MAG: rhomboid family intramembrane serine protease [Acidobacteriota bacterium]|nr:rhomboid family intramembrane serine protease [Acidobacteriota bacterium]
MSHYHRGPTVGGVTFAFPPLTPMIRLILITLGGAFIAQMFLQLLGGGELLGRWVALSTTSLLGRLAFWELATYALLHGGLWHLLFNMLGIYMFGGDVERVLGSNHTLRYFVVCVVGGGVVFVLLDLMAGRGAGVIGASAGVLGIVIAFAVFFPNRQVFLFPLPFPVKAWVLAAFFALFNLYGAIASNSGIDPSFGQGQAAVAFGAHLGGMAIGYVYLQGLVRPGGFGELFRRKGKRSSFRVIDGDRDRGGPGPYDLH